MSSGSQVRTACVICGHFPRAYQKPHDILQVRLNSLINIYKVDGKGQTTCSFQIFVKFKEKIYFIKMF